MRTARAKGISSTAVDRRHVLRNAMLPISTIIGLQVGLLLSGAILTETVFAFPGIGTWLQAAIEQPRLPGAPGRHPVRRGRRRARQPARRPLLRVPQSAHPAGGTLDVRRRARGPRARARAAGRRALARRASQAHPQPRRDLRRSCSSGRSSSSRSSRRCSRLRPDASRTSTLVEDGCCPGPSREHLLGVDDLGRDELSRLIYGARYSLLIGVVAVTVGLVVRPGARRVRRLLPATRRPDHARDGRHARDPRLPDGDRDRRAVRARAACSR